jgi:hypothetical protein
MTETITPDMTVLDVVSTFNSTIAVFKAYDEKTGECICCNCLFLTLKELAAGYSLDLQVLLSDLASAAAEQP